jgi:transposase-like protein
MVAEVTPDYPSQWAAINAVAQKLEIGTSETLLKWVRRAEIDDGRRPGADRRGAPGDQAAEAGERRTAASQRDPQGGVEVLRGGARLPTAALVKFISDRKAEFGVEPICAVFGVRQ